MSRGELVADAVRRGAGRAAIVLGRWCEAYRPTTPDRPLAPQNRVLRLQASFNLPGEGNRPPGYGAALWWGVFDSAYTRVGDYICRPESRAGAKDGAVWFVASQEPMLPVLCVQAGRVVDIARPGGAGSQGLNGYGGVVRGNAATIARRWPVSLLTAGGRGATGAELPAGIPAGSWLMLMPTMPGVSLARGDIVADGEGLTGIVSSAEQSAMGWRAIVREAVA
jgi:hypothetical protein